MDFILKQMAAELREVLLAKGADPKSPPPGFPGKAAAKATWREYKKRGGSEYTEQRPFMEDLVKEVGK